MHLAIRADGGPSRGYGHLVRTGHLASTFLDRGWQVTYLTTTPAAARSVAPVGVDVVEIDEEDEPAIVRAWLVENDVDAVLTDHYDVDQDYQRVLRNVCRCLAVRHGYPNHALACDLLLYGNLVAERVEYEWEPPEPRWCLGPEYLLLDQEFARLAAEPVDVTASPERLLVTMGGSDVNDATPDVLAAIRGFDGQVNVIVGPGFTNQAAIRAAAADVEGEVKLREDPDDLPAIMEAADIAVTALGTTAYELLATSTPFVGIPQAENQMNRAEELRRRGLAVVLERSPDVDAIRSGVQRLLADEELRRRIASSDVIDGRGCQRAADAIVDCVSSD